MPRCKHRGEEIQRNCRCKKYVECKHPEIQNIVREARCGEMCRQYTAQIFDSGETGGYDSRDTEED